MVRYFALDKICILLLILLQYNFAYFDLNYTGNYSAGLANSNITDLENPTPVINPASAGDIIHTTVDISYTSLFTGLKSRIFNEQTDYFNLGSISYVYPLSSAEYAPASKTINYYVVYAAVYFFQTKLYSEYRYYLGFTKPLIKNWYYGINFKIYQYGFKGNIYTENNPVLLDKQLSKTSYNFDFGTIYQINENFNVGLTFKNIIPYKIKILETDFDYTPEINIGGDYSYTFNDYLKSTVFLTYSLNTKKVNNSIQNKVLLGIKNDFEIQKRKYSVLIGVGPDNTNIGFRLHFDNNYLKMQFYLDYVFTIPYNIRHNYGHQNVSLTVLY